MVSFRKVTLALAALAISASLASAQVITPFTPSILRAEGVTELLPTLQFSTTTAGNYSITVYSSVPVTSAVGEPMLQAADLVGLPPAAPAPVVGQVIGTTVVFPNVTVQAGDKLTLSGIRVNANMLPTLASGFTPGTGENLFIIASPLTPGGAPLFGANDPALNISNVAYAVPTLSVTTPTTATALSNCTASPFDPTSDTLPANGSFWVGIAELYNQAFQNLVGEGGFATNGTQFELTFTNVPTNTVLYVPATITSGTLLNPFTISVVSPAASTALANGAVAVPASGVVIYEVMTSTAGLDATTIPVYVAFTGQPVAGAASPTVTVQYAPVSTNAGAANKPIPRFNVSTPVTGSKTFTVITCTTSLLFPYVTASGGYDTGLAIANTATDPGGKTLGSTGACTWYFYGTGAPAAPVVGPVVAPGAISATVLSTIAPGFQGYAVAQCTFNYAHGYAYVVNGITNASQSYLPLVITGRTGVASGIENLNN
jgi:hypothetical protein